VVHLFNLEDIIASGELIIGTLSGPDTYFEYRGRGFGLQYSLAEDYARSIGVMLRVEVAHDTAELTHWLQTGEIDLLAMQLPATPNTHQCKSKWLVRKGDKELALSIDEWYRPELLAQIRQRENKQSRSHVVKRRPRPMMLNAQKGIISQFDGIFQRHASTIGWDWRLLAAQCYQESAFDPKAVSWAGAQGLMQLMPETAQQLGVSNVWNPEENIAAATRYIKQLNTKFSDIRDAHERISFVLAAYNGGVGHVRDAMALARKNGRNSSVWREVSTYILLLENPRYYHDSVVKYGYLRGSETEGYVRYIKDRWRQYCGQVRHNSAPPLPPTHKSQVRSRETFLNGNDSLK